MRIRWLVVLLLVGLWPWLAWADMASDGIDDDATTGLALSTFLSASSGSYGVWFKPTGSAPAGGSDCYNGRFIFGDMTGSTGETGLYRNNNFLGTGDRLCGQANDGTTRGQFGAAYSAGTWYLLGWVHVGGQFAFYVNGVLLGTQSVGAISSLSAQVRLGGWNGGWEPAEGVYGEARIYAGDASSEFLALGTSGLKRAGWLATTGAWDFDACAIGANCDGVTIPDRSGNQRPMVGDDGPNLTGLTGVGATLSYPWGVW
jgi:Concanavalin A-like lectin/glucanases superfamily